MKRPLESYSLKRYVESEIVHNLKESPELSSQSMYKSDERSLKQKVDEALAKQGTAMKVEAGSAEYLGELDTTGSAWQYTSKVSTVENPIIARNLPNATTGQDKIMAAFDQLASRSESQGIWVPGKYRQYEANGLLVDEIEAKTYAVQPNTEQLPYDFEVEWIKTASGAAPIVVNFGTISASDAIQEIEMELSEEDVEKSPTVATRLNFQLTGSSILVGSTVTNTSQAKFPGNTLYYSGLFIWNKNPSVKWMPGMKHFKSWLTQDGSVYTSHTVEDSSTEWITNDSSATAVANWNNWYSSARFFYVANSFKLKSYKLTSKSTRKAVVNLIAVSRDGVGCLYDRVSNQIYTAPNPSYVVTGPRIY